MVERPAYTYYKLFEILKVQSFLRHGLIRYCIECSNSLSSTFATGKHVEM